MAGKTRGSKEQRKSKKQKSNPKFTVEVGTRMADIHAMVMSGELSQELMNDMSLLCLREPEEVSPCGGRGVQASIWD